MNGTETRDIPSAGRGVIATTLLAAGTKILDSGPPAFHVIFRAYRKEVCAQCFFYNNSRALPVRDNDTDKVFCSAVCQADWITDQGNTGALAWRSLATLVRARVKNASNGRSGLVGGNAPRPDAAMIDQYWDRAEQEAEEILHHRQEAAVTGNITKRGKGKKPKAGGFTVLSAFDPDVLSYLLSGIQFYQHSSSAWYAEVAQLAQDPTPYKSEVELQTHCASWVQLAHTIPPQMFCSLPPRFGRLLVNADNHNAFGISSGSEDLEEYMGYAVYPCASYFNHSCSPNLRKTRHGRAWVFTAARNILPGEECCITYLGGDERHLDAAARRRRLRDVWGFECQCSHCVAESI